VNLPSVVVSAGFLIGLGFGAVGLLSGFCLTSGLRNWWTQGDGRLIRTFALALATAMIGTQWLAAEGVVDLAKSIYLLPSFSAPVMLFGGLLFGYGMVMANACPSRSLVLLGRGNLRSLAVVATVAITAQMTLTGLIAPARIAVVSWSQTAPHAISLPALLAAAGLDAAIARLLAAAIVAGTLVVFALAYAPFRRSSGQIAAGVAIGLLVPAGWLATSYLGADDFEPTALASLTFIAPLSDTLKYVMFSTGTNLSFGIAVVAGVPIGSFVTALITGRLQWEGYSSPGHMLRSIGGAALMGGGGAMALGCSIGQGLTGLSTLALASFIAAAGILIGAAAALRGPIREPALAAT
jgi:hypothetical protein